MLKKTIFFITLLFLSLCAHAVPYSNVIFLGDSLSDVGNFPMTSGPYYHPKLPPSIYNLYGMFYVPVSNPVNLHGYKVSLVKLFHLQHKPYAWPDLSKDILPTMPKIAGEERTNHSYSWSEFFLADAKQDGLIPSAKIMPSMLIQQTGIQYPVRFSVDYAFASATSEKGCNYKYHFKHFGACTFAQIQQARQRLLIFHGLENYNLVLVPGLQKQVGLLENDVKAKRVAVNNKTLYVIWIGGNDFLKDLVQLKSFILSRQVAAFKNLFERLNENVETTTLNLIKSPQIQAKNILIFGFFNPAHIVPALHRTNWFEKIMIKDVVDHYNHQLKNLVSTMNRQFPEVNIHYVPVPIWIKAMANPDSKYKQIFQEKNRGLACQLSNINYSKPKTPSANCKGFLFWNAVHPSSSVQQILGYLADQYLLKI